MKNQPQNYKEAREYIENTGAGRAKIELGLQNIRELLIALQQPQKKSKYIHLAGTNGKGSIGAFLASVLAEAGYRVGRFLTPAVFDYREQIQIIERNGQSDSDGIQSAWIAEESIVDHIAEIYKAVEKMEYLGKTLPSPFEIETAMAFLEFAEKQCDIVLLEVGMGGRLDATNIIDRAECSVLSSISMDHMEFLGDTLAKIAREKAGIIKPSVPVISDEQEKEAEVVISEVAKEQGSPLTIVRSSRICDIQYGEWETTFSYKGTSYFISLLGENQVKNAVTAIETIHVLQEKGYLISEDAIQKGLKRTQWKGRFHRIHEHPIFMVDGAHNEGAACSLRKSIEIYFKGRTLFYIVGMLADKECDRVLEITAGDAAEIFTITPNNPRALSSTDLAEKARAYCKIVWDVGDVDTAIKKAFERAESDNVILAFGSLSFLGEVYSNSLFKKLLE